MSVLAQNNAETEPGFKTGSPTDNLPPYVKFISGFGERPNWSHDGKFFCFWINRWVKFMN
jgi:hypothetical protein